MTMAKEPTTKAWVRWDRGVCEATRVLVGLSGASKVCKACSGFRSTEMSTVLPS